MRFQVAYYDVQIGYPYSLNYFDRSFEALATVTCYDAEKKHRLTAFFLSNRSPLPENIWEEKSSGDITGQVFLPISALDTFISLLGQQTRLPANAVDYGLFAFA